jgi:hypothetical protein
MQYFVIYPNSCTGTLYVLAKSHRIRLTGTRADSAFSERSSSGSSNDNSFIHAFVVTCTYNVPFALIDCGDVTFAICGPTSFGQSGMIAA